MADFKALPRIAHANWRWSVFSDATMLQFFIALISSDYRMQLSPRIAELALLSCILVFGANFGTVVVIGGHASDLALDVSDTDNLTVREAIHLPENLGGRPVFSRDRNTLYAISDSSVTVPPLCSLASVPWITAPEEL